MEASLYLDYVQRFFKSVSHGVIEKLNGSTKPLTYLHTTMLRLEFSVTGKWETLTINGTVVAADYVAMDSSLPLKRRDSFGRASGDIPKQGMEMWLNEQQLTEIDTMIATNVDDTTIAARLFGDTAKCIQGIYEKNEYSFLLGLSTGVTVVDDGTNTGTGIRMDFKYLPENKFGVSVLWSNVASTPMQDIRNKVISKASLDGKSVVRVLVDLATMTNILKTNEAKDLYALYIGNFGTTKIAPTLAKFNELVAADDTLGFTFQVIDRSVNIEKNGVRTMVKPWATGQVACITTEVVGSLTYATLAEQNHKVEGVSYENPTPYMMVSKYRLHKPSISEWTSSQARVLPVISETVYLIDSLTVQA